MVFMITSGKVKIKSILKQLLGYFLSFVKGYVIGTISAIVFMVILSAILVSIAKGTSNEIIEYCKLGEVTSLRYNAISQNVFVYKNDEEAYKVLSIVELPEDAQKKLNRVSDLTRKKEVILKETKE